MPLEVPQMFGTFISYSGSRGNLSLIDTYISGSIGYLKLMVTYFLVYARNLTLIVTVRPYQTISSFSVRGRIGLSILGRKITNKHCNLFYLQNPLRYGFHIYHIKMSPYPYTAVGFTQTIFQFERYIC